jgi:hypothetical protein
VGGSVIVLCSAYVANARIYERGGIGVRLQLL